MPRDYSHRTRVKPKDVRFTCDPERLGFETTNDFTSKPHIIGQDRALSAIQLGLEMSSPGYNIYISGLTGTGKSTAIKRILDASDLRRDDLMDICYVYNFKLPESPVCIQLPAGIGGQLQGDLEHFRETITNFIPLAFQSDKFKERRTELVNDVKERKAKVTQELEKELADNGFTLVEVSIGPYHRPEIAPVVGGETVPMEHLPGLYASGKLGQGDYNKIRRVHPLLMTKLDEVLTMSRDLDRELGERLEALERDHVKPMVTYAVKEIKDKYKFDKVRAFLEDLQQFIIDHIKLFMPGEDNKPPEHLGDLLVFDVNVIVDNAGAKEAPVIIETSPTYTNLFGSIERVSDGEEYHTDFTNIRAGSLLRANGGYLVLNLFDVFEEPHVWTTLKRALKHQSLVIRGFDSLLLMPIATIKPDPIDLDVKVVLIGDAYSYQVLYEWDEDFGKIFKVKAEFDSVMPNNKRNQKRYTQFIKNLCEGEKLLPFHKSGAASIIEESVRLAGRKDRLSTQFSDIGDLIRESSYWAKSERARSVRDSHVTKAVERRVNRVSLYEEKVQEMITRGSILMDVRGAKVGQVNALTVYDVGDYQFGRPARITVETGVGRSGVINIEREADMSGRTFNKGVLILDGYLRRLYAQDKPITMSASICFEQSYSGIDGDSASAAEIFALLSSLSGVPVRQDLAVTGSVNQKGEIQPIGGVNEKVEGFFDVCKQQGLTGSQGVIIPKQNKADLILRKEVAEAVAKEKFHVYAISRIDEGLELLTGRKAGKWRSSYRFPKDTVHHLVDERLRTFARRLHTSEDGSDDGDGDKSGDEEKKPARKKPKKKRGKK